MFKSIWIILAFFNAQHHQHIKDSIKACYPKNKIIFLAGSGSNTANKGIYNTYNIPASNGENVYYSPYYSDNINTYFSPVAGARLSSEQNQFFGFMLGMNYSIKSFGYNYKNDLSSYAPKGVLPVTYNLTSQTGSGLVSCHVLSGEFFLFLKLPLDFKIYGGVVLNTVLARSYKSNIAVMEKSILTKSHGGNLFNPPPDSLVTEKSGNNINNLKPSILPDFMITYMAGIEKSFLLKNKEYLIGINYGFSNYSMGIQFYLAKSLGLKNRKKTPKVPKIEEPKPSNEELKSSE